MWDEIKGDDKFGWGEEKAGDNKRRLGMKRRRVTEEVEEEEVDRGAELAALWGDQQVAGSSTLQDRLVDRSTYMAPSMETYRG